VSDPNSTSTTNLQQIGYTWDELGNLMQRQDVVNGLTENYFYDQLSRLTSITLPNAGNQVENSFSYDLIGDMLTKQDVGTYSYPPAGSAQPHGVSSITGSTGTTNFVYDADGNLTTETGAITRSLAWNLFNKPRTITYGGNVVTLQFDADHNKVLQLNTPGNAFYVPGADLTAGDVWHTYFVVNGEKVAEDYGPPGGPFQHHYFHNDYQNTIGLVTDDNYVYGQASTTAQNEGSDVFGQPRLPTGAIDPNWGANDATKRRYINQEDVPDSHLIDLNARFYDPLLGKFLSPDPVISDQDDSQSWNAYAYSHNNPMSGEDPTGTLPRGAINLNPGYDSFVDGAVEVDGSSGGRFGNGPSGEFGSGGVSSPQVYGQSSFSVPSAFGQSSGSPSGAGSIAGGLQHQSVQVAQIPMGLCALGPGGCAAGAAITAGQLLTGAAVIGGVAGGAIVVQHEMDNAQGTADGAQAPGATPPNLAPPNADRDAALAAAKAAAGIVADHPPEVLPNYGKNPGLDSKPIPDSEILRYLDNDLNVQDIGHDYGGHQYPDDPSQNRGPHFNYPLGGGHYDYDSPGIPFNPGYFPKGSQ
jgi:RHS repeat-associated protein